MSPKPTDRPLPLRHQRHVTIRGDPVLEIGGRILFSSHSATNLKAIAAMILRAKFDDGSGERSSARRNSVRGKRSTRRLCSPCGVLMETRLKKQGPLTRSSP